MDMEPTIQVQTQAENHGGIIKAGGRKLRCFTKKQLKAFHPGGYKLAGECRTKDLTGVMAKDSAALRPPGTYSRWRYAEKGYWSCGENRYVALLKPALTQRLLVVLAGIMVVAGAVLAAVFWPDIAAVPPVSNTPSVSIDPHAQDYVGEKKQPNKGDPDAANTQIPGYKSVEIDAASGELNIAPHNPEGNPCYFVISIETDGQEVYRSGMIAPGQALYNVKADPIPAAGTYTATIRYECYHLTTQTPLNGAEIQVDLIVQ